MREGDTNLASYELCLAKSLLLILAERLKEDEKNVIYSAADHITRAKNEIDGVEVSNG